MSYITSAVTGGSGSPGGSSPEIQFNNAGSFGGTTGLEYDSSGLALRGLTTLTGGHRLFNTADTTTNFEVLRMFWSTNVAFLITDTLGTGQARELRLGTYSAGGNSNLFRIFGLNATTQFIQQGVPSSSTSFIGTNILNTLTAASATQIVWSVTPTINQSGTAGYTILHVNATHTATGSGTKRLLDLSVGGTSFFNVDSAGHTRWNNSGFTFQPGTTPKMFAYGTTVSGGQTLLQLGGNAASEIAPASGTATVLGLAPLIGSSSTGAWTILDINPNDTGGGTGQRALINCRYNGTELFHINSLGVPRYNPSATQSLLAANAISIDRGYIKVQGNGGAVTLTSAPTIAAGTEGQVIFIIGQSNTNTVTVQDRGTLASSNLRLGATTRTLGTGDVLALVYDGTLWSEMYFANNL